MQNKSILSIVMLSLFVLMTSLSFAQESIKIEGIEGHGPVNTKEGVDEAMNHHLQDSHYFEFFSDGEAGKHYGFSLPVIIVDNGVKTFSASLFEHGSSLVKVDDAYYRLYDSKIYKTDASGEITLKDNGFPANERPLDLSITKNVLITMLIVVVLFLVFTSLAKSYKKNAIPTGFGRILEPMIIFVRDDIAKTNIGPKYHKYMGYLLTIFFFILFLNLLGMFPFGVNVTGNITVTFTLAMITFFITQFSGNKNYWKHVFWFPDVHPIMKIILIPIEILGMFTKPFALMIRLFANMTAGHVITMSLLGLIFVYQNWIAGPAFFGFSLFIMVIEILVAFLQAYIFTLLSALYIGAAVEEHHTSADDTEELPIV